MIVKLFKNIFLRNKQIQLFLILRKVFPRVKVEFRFEIKITRGCFTSPNYTNYDKIPSFTLDNRFFFNFTRFPISPIAFTRFYDKFPQLYTNLRRFPNCPKDSPSLRKIRRNCPLLRKIRKIPLFYTQCLQKILMSTKEVKSKIKLFN